MDDARGRRLADRYVLEDALASGGMGALWLARDEVLGRPVAVKVLHDHLAGDEELLERFRIEAVAAARLSHPSVVRVFDTGIDQGTCFIVMELVEGSTLAAELRRLGPLAPHEAVRVLRGVLQALGHAHREGVIHRDVKPANIMLGQDDRVKLTDFGIAKAAFAGADVTTTGNLLGTSRYVSPEQVGGGTVDARSDLYSAGVVLYEALTGRPPFDADTHIATATMRLTTDPAPPRSLRPGIPRALEAVVLRALARDPEARFQSAEEMNAALEHAVRGGARPAPVEAPPERRPPVLRAWIGIPIGVAVAAALVVGGFLLLERSPAGPGPRAANRTSPAAPLEIVALYSFDPQGTGGEHDETLSSSTDGDPSTAWTTEGYASPDLGGIKDGVGLVVELEDAREVAGIELQTDLPGWRFDVFAGDAPDGFDLDASLAGSGFVAGDAPAFEIEPVETAYLLIWITSLVQADDGKYRAHVNEIELLGA